MNDTKLGLSKNIYVQVIFLILAIIVTNYNAISSFIIYSLDPDLFNNDTRILTPYFKITDPDLFPDDHIISTLGNFDPVGYHAVNYVLLQFFSLTTLHITMPIMLLLLTAALTALIGFKTTGWLGAWAAASIFLQSNLILERISAPLPHSFAFLIVAMILVSLLYSRPYLQAFTTIFAGAFYPPLAPLAGLIQFGYLFILSKKLQGYSKGWSILKRLVILSITFIALLLVMHHMIEATIVESQAENKEIMPELEAGGRVGGATTNPVIYTMGRIFMQYNPVIATLFLVLVFGYGLSLKQIKKEPLFSNISIFLGASIFLYIFSYIFASGWSFRFLLYTIPFILIILFPVLLSKILEKNHFKGNKHVVSFIVLILIYLQSLAAPSQNLYGFDIEIEEKYKPTYEFIESLPVDTLIAGWPEKSGYIIENVPYISQRRAFMLHETYQSLSKEYMLEMRKRMYAIIDAFFATDKAHISQLQEEWGVNYLIVNTHIFNKKPKYFNPFQEKIDKIWENKERFILPNLLEELAIYHDKENNIYILDLKKLPSTKTTINQ